MIETHNDRFAMDKPLNEAEQIAAEKEALRIKVRKMNQEIVQMTNKQRGAR